MITKIKMIKPDIKKSAEERIMDGVAAWASFYRANINRFVEDYLHVHLKLFQQILIVMMNVCNYSCYMAGRGQQIGSFGE